MSIVVEVSLLVIAIFIAVLVIFLVQTLRKAQRSLEAARVALHEAQGAVKEWRGNVDAIGASVKDLAHKINREMDGMNLDAVREVAGTLQEAAAALVKRDHTARAQRGAAAAAQRGAAAYAERIAAAYAAVMADPLRPGSPDADNRRDRARSGAQEEDASRAWAGGWIDVGIEVTRLIRAGRSKG